MVFFKNIFGELPASCTLSGPQIYERLWAMRADTKQTGKKKKQRQKIKIHKLSPKVCVVAVAVIFFSLDGRFAFDSLPKPHHPSIRSHKYGLNTIFKFTKLEAKEI